jgi:hypothetical protein
VSYLLGMPPPHAIAEKVIVAIAVVVLSILAVAALRPSTIQIQRSRNIQAPAEKVFALIKDFQNWPLWAPQDREDPTMKRAFSGPEAGLRCHSQQPQAKQTAQSEVNLIDGGANFCGDPPAISLKASRMQEAEYVPMDAVVHDGHGFRRSMAQLLLSPGCRRVRHVLRRDVDSGLFRGHSQLLTSRSDLVSGNRPLERRIWDRVEWSVPRNAANARKEQREFFSRRASNSRFSFSGNKDLAVLVECYLQIHRQQSRASS